ncbi:Hypothetical protein, putative [Bodo saltans]|uniref:Uncharacterized protein n=1 Tax=Bodo saltans TaxID=75058 RepID=A0A0S4IPS3_BODSA|nr:Hypothetical protein, putative [Bodo saltans]|eukprot:CUF10980.1 Hypothetical protein, putative [Bodo saltans]
MVVLQHTNCESNSIVEFPFACDVCILFFRFSRHPTAFCFLTKAHANKPLSTVSDKTNVSTLFAFFNVLLLSCEGRTSLSPAIMACV